MAQSTPLKDEELQKLQNELINRMVQTGKWAEIQQKLKTKLNDASWLDQVKSQAKERARNQENLTFAGLYGEVSPWALNNLPADIQQDVMIEIQAFILSQVDEAGNV